MLTTTSLLLAALSQIAAGAPQPITGIENAFPAWSPDGKQLVFQSNRTGDFQLYVMNPDGGDVKRWTATHEDARAVWSPDGSQIAFTRRRARSMDIWVLPVAGYGSGTR